MSAWVYVRSEPQLWTTGFYTPDGDFETDSDHDSKEDAARRVHWLNGGDSEGGQAKNQIGEPA